jgi:hypothetical protein
LEALPRGCGNGGDEKSVEKREIQNDPNIIYPYSSYSILFHGLNMLLICSNVSNILQYLLISAPSQRVCTFLNSQQSAFSFTKFYKAMRKKMLFFASQVYAHTEAPNTGGGSNFTLFAAAGPHPLQLEKQGQNGKKIVKICQELSR